MDLTTKLYFRHGLCSSNENADSYIMNTIRNMEINTEFGRYAAILKNLPEEYLRCAVPKLREAGYDIMLAFSEQDSSSIVGHMAFQQHEEDPRWRMFSLYVKENCRGNGYGLQLTRRFIQHARDCGIRTIRLGAGNSPKMNSINEKLKKEEAEHNLNVNLKNQFVTIYC